MPHRGQLQKLVTLAAATAAGPAIAVSRLDMLTVSNAAIYSGICEKTIRQGSQGRSTALHGGPIARPAAKDWTLLDQTQRSRRLQGQQLRPLLKKGRWARANPDPQAGIAVIAVPGTDGENSTRRPI